MTNPFEVIEARLSNIENLLHSLKHSDPKKSEEIMDLEALEDLTGYRPSYLRKLVFEKRIPFQKPNGGRVFFLRSEILDWIKSGRQATRDEIAKGIDEQLTKNP